MPLFFALDHQNYARWVPVFIRDLKDLPDSIKEEFKKGHWTVTRGNHRFSSLPIDQAHEQANKRVKGVGGIIGLTENHDMLERWIMTGSEISRIVEGFKGGNNEDDVLPHHEEGFAYQHRYTCICHTRDMIEVLLTESNPFEERSGDLVTLDNKVCESPDAVVYVYNIETLGQKQHNNFKQGVLNLMKLL